MNTDTGRVLDQHNSIAGAGECSCPSKTELVQPTGIIVVLQEKIREVYF